MYGYCMLVKNAFVKFNYYFIVKLIQKFMFLTEMQQNISMYFSDKSFTFFMRYLLCCLIDLDGKSGGWSSTLSLHTLWYDFGQVILFPRTSVQIC